MSSLLLEQMIDPVADCFTAESAERILAARAELSLQQRIDELAAKANQGELTAAEQAEYDRYLAAYHLITALQSRARRFLRS